MLSSMDTVIKYFYHNAVSRISPIIPHQSMTSSKNRKKGLIWLKMKERNIAVVL